MKVYISGRITGDPNYRKKFQAAAVNLAGQGITPLNPAEGNEGLHNSAAMRRAVNMLFEADAVLMLPGWQRSRGARIERRLARYLGLPVACSKRIVKRFAVNSAFLTVLFGGMYAVGYVMSALLRAAGV